MEEAFAPGPISPLAALVVVVALAILAALLYGSAGPRRHRDPVPTDGTRRRGTVRRRRSHMGRVGVWMLRRMARSAG